jgi:hypothetical protein
MDRIGNRSAAQRSACKRWLGSCWTELQERRHGRAKYHPSYWGAFVIDPDGNNKEAVCHRPE